MKKNFLLLGILLSLFNANAQNPLWSVAPNYIDLGGQNDATVTLPIPYHYLNNPNPNIPATSFQEDHELYYYHGQSATTVSNAQADAQGNLLFFIVDNKIYDGEGYLIAALETPDGWESAPIRDVQRAGCE